MIMTVIMSIQVYVQQTKRKRRRFDDDDDDYDVYTGLRAAD